MDSLDDFYLYAQNGEKIDKYNYMCEGDNCTAIYYDSETGYEACAVKTRLSELMRIPKVKQFFKEQGYAIDFKLNDGVLLPAILQNIYKGALGEVVGRFLLESWGWKLCDISDLTKFEKFDFCLEVASDVYIDFKNWSENTREEQEYLIVKSKEKLSAICGKKVFIINMVAEDFAMHDFGSVVTVSTIFKKKGACLYELDNENINVLIARIKEAVDESHN